MKTQNVMFHKPSLATQSENHIKFAITRNMSFDEQPETNRRLVLLKRFPKIIDLYICIF